MAPPTKRKRRPLPKRACPCCSAILSEKTIERHLGGTHVPNRIQVTRAAASSHPHSLNPINSYDDLSSDVASDASGVSSNVSPSVSSDHESKDVTIVAPLNDINPPFNDIDPPFNDPVNDELAEIVRNTWSGRRGDNYDEDTEDEDTEDEDYHGSPIDDIMPNEEHDSDAEFELGSDETGMRNGLGLDDLANEDFQRIIAEFGTSFLLSFRPK